MSEELCLTSHISPLAYQSMYNDYLFNKIHNEQTLTTMINKQLIMTESTTTLAQKERKLSALYEAKVGDSCKSAWNKFTDFINNLFSKFMESITKLLFSYKKYLEKYRDIILNKKFKIELSAPLPGNYVDGVKRCFDTQIPQIQYDDKYMKPLKEGGDYEVLKLIIPNHNFDEGKEMTDSLKEYFLGIDVGTIDSLDRLNRADMYNFCYNAEKIETIGKKDISNIQNTTKVIEEAINKEINAANPTQESASYYTEGKLTDNKYLVNSDGSVNKKGGGTTGDNEEKTTATATNNNSSEDKKGEDKVAQAGKVNTNPIASSTSDVTTNNDKLKQQGETDGKDAAKNNDTEKAITDAFNKWRTVCQAVITAKMTAQEAIAKDYMGIIRAHVRSYVGKSDDMADKETQKATNYGSNNKNNNDNQKAEEKQRNAKGGGATEN